VVQAQHVTTVQGTYIADDGDFAVVELAAAKVRPPLSLDALTVRCYAAMFLAMSGADKLQLHCLVDVLCACVCASKV
jgi:hypothetical protein